MNRQHEHCPACYDRAGANCPFCAPPARPGIIDHVLTALPGLCFVIIAAMLAASLLGLRDPDRSELTVALAPPADAPVAP